MSNFEKKEVYNNLNRKSYGPVLMQHKAGEVEYLTFPALEDTGVVEHVIATRLGGVSKGIFDSMNLSFTRGDDPAAVEENFRRMAVTMHADMDDVVFTEQTHTTNVRVVTDEDRGKGLTRDRDYTDIDGLVTNVPGVVLTTFFADCVPLFFVDPVHKAIGLSHSGWRGTVGKIGQHTLKVMAEQYGTDPKDVIAAIGPSICQDCYEVSADVAEQFFGTFGDSLKKLEDEMKTGKLNQTDIQKIDNIFTKASNDTLAYKKENGKYQLNLWFANFLGMYEAGIPVSQISVTDLCTCCNPEYLFSHRATNGERGGLAAFMKLKGMI